MKIRVLPIISAPRAISGLLAVLLFIGFSLANPALAGQSPSRTEPRYALLIANSNYSYYTKLPNPVPEAKALKTVLEGLGFQVTLVVDASKDQMQLAVMKFGKLVSGQRAIAFFHYGGHAVQLADKNYLIPATAEIPNLEMAQVYGFDVGEITGNMAGNSGGTNIIILDSCRNNPLAGSGRSASRGLTNISPPSNSVIAYSAKAGSVAQDGLYTPTLSRKLATPGASLQEILMDVRKEVVTVSKGEQTPGEYSELLDPVYLNGKSARSGGANISLSVRDAGQVYIDGTFLQDLPKDGKVDLSNLPEGLKTFEIRYGDQTEKKLVNLKAGDSQTVSFVYERNPVFFARLDAALPGATVKLGTTILKPNSQGLFEVPAGDQTLAVEHPQMQPASFTVTGASRQLTVLDWTKPVWRTGSFAVTDLPPDTTIQLTGASGLVYKLVQSGNGAFNPSQDLVIGDYQVVFSGPFLEAYNTKAIIQEGKTSTLSPRLKEYGLLDLSTSSTGKMVAYIDDAASGTRLKTLDLQSGNVRLSCTQGNYRLLVKRADDLAPALVKEFTISARTAQKINLSDPGYSVAWRYKRADLARKDAARILGPLQQTSDSTHLAGWILLGAGIASGAVSTWAYFDGIEKYDSYLANQYSSTMDSYRSAYQDASYLFSATLIAGISGLTGGIITHLLAPDPDRAKKDSEKRQEEFELLKAEYQALPGYLKSTEVAE